MMLKIQVHWLGSALLWRLLLLPTTTSKLYDENTFVLKLTWEFHKFRTQCWTEEIDSFSDYPPSEEVFVHFLYIAYWHFE